jgi:hypothetical protein
MGDQPVARPLPKQRTTQTQKNAHTHKTYMSEPTITASEQAKTVHASDHSATVTGLFTITGEKLWNEIKVVKGQRNGRKLMKDDDSK